MTADELLKTFIDLLPQLSSMGLGTGIVLIVLICAWKDSWPWKGRDRK